MLATPFLLQNLAVIVALDPLMAVSATSSSGGSIVSYTPPATISSEPPPECTGTGATVMMPKAEPVGELHTALDSASITYGLPPSVPCSVLAVLPSSLQDDFADFETRWYDWWQTQRNNFSSWASTCSGQYTGAFGDLASEYLNATSSMDGFTPRVTDCAEFTGSGVQVTSTETGAGVASETVEAGQNGGGSLWMQHIATVSIVVATVTGIVLIV